MDLRCGVGAAWVVVRTPGGFERAACGRLSPGRGRARTPSPSSSSGLTAAARGRGVSGRGGGRRSSSFQTLLMDGLCGWW